MFFHRHPAPKQHFVKECPRKKDDRGRGKKMPPPGIKLNAP
jgi:hypothetical protein